MRNNKITQVLNVARNVTRKGFQDGGSPSVLDMARSVMARMGSDAAGAVKERYVDNPSNIPADAAQLAINLAKRIGPAYAVMEPTSANEGEDEVARQMRMGLRKTPKGYAEEPVNRAKGGRLLQDQFPSKYMPGVGRQVMAAGGSNEPLAEGDHPHWIPTRLVKLAKNRRPNDIVDMDSFRSAPGGFFDKNMALVRDYVNIPADIAKNASNDELAEHFIEHMKSNLLDLHDRIPPEIRERSQKWYDGARNITDNWSKKFNLPDYSVAGVLAALSPQMDWYKNVSLAHRTLDIMSNHHDDKADDAMKKRFGELVVLNSKPKYAALGEFLHGKSLSDIDRLGLPEKERIAAKALWVRLHDETYGDRRHRIITPEGDEGDYVTKGSGDAAGTGWGSFNEIGKAIKAIESKDDPAAISPLMGMKHKVRNFYNNIIAPNSTKGDITADTHAVAAALYRPLSGASTEVAHNLGTNPPAGVKAASDSAIAGISGTYPLVAEAYRRAAGERGILPRQMQSITWEAIRGLFPATFKNAKNKSEVDKIWQSFKNGALTQEEAREKVRDKALGQGQPIPPPSWFGKGVRGGAGGPNAPAQNPREQGELPRLGALGQPAEGAVAGAGARSPPPLAEEVIPNEPQPQRFAGGGYVTRQDGPYYRVHQTDDRGSGSAPEGARREVREAPAVERGGSGPAEYESAELPPHEGPSGLTEARSPLELAQQHVRDVHGREFEPPKMPESSLAKQSAIGRVYSEAVGGSPEYKNAIFSAYAQQMPEVIEQSGAQNYDDLLRKSYEQMAKETDDQFRLLKGYQLSFHKNGEGNYPTSKHMVDDVNNNKHLFVYQGGDKHDFLHNEDPETGLNENEKFRAVHDLFGHAILGNQFGPKGEETAWGVHQQMYSPLARLAMTAETRGQNSFVNYTPINAELKEKLNDLEERIVADRRAYRDTSMLEDRKKKMFEGFQFAPNKAVLLPPEFLSTEYNGGMPSYMKDIIRPAEGTGMSSKLTHFSNEPGLTETDPSRYGTGIKGDEASRLRSVPGAVKDRSYFYLGEPEAVTPEEGLGQHRYEASAENLYNLAEDPLKFKTLAREANRRPWASNFNPGTVDPNRFSNDLERLAKEHGYSGVANPNAAFPMAAMFDPTPVTPRADGGGVNADDGDDGFTAYHGSPHDFEKLDTSKIGSGIGAQAYGHGLYLSDSEDVAKGYAGRDASAAPANQGHMYKMHIQANPNHFLDWDAPLRDQPYILQAIDQHIGDPNSIMDQLFGHRDVTGRDLHEKFGGEHKPKAVAEKLSSMGIPGIKYVDEGMITPAHRGVKNYVVFNPENVKVQEKYAKGGAVQTKSVDVSHPNFQSWFGKSVTHDNGVPRKFYTGTSKDVDFPSFKVGRHGVWFTTDPSVASAYAKENDSQGYRRDGWDVKPVNTASRVIPTYLKAENPYTGSMPQASMSENYKKSQSEWFDTLRAQGYDSWIPQSQQGNLAVILQHPGQIKSAVSNSGDFDLDQKRIDRADGGEINADDIPSIDNPISVFPKPQRMYSDEDRVPGGQYLDAKTKADLTGKKAAMASIGINPGGKPYFNASPDDVDETGSPGKGSALTKANLFKQKAGWKWLQAPEGHEDTSTVVSVAHRGDHHYALNAHFPKGVDFARYENASSEPRLRPTTRGNIIKGDQVGSISVRGKEHPVYDHIIVKAAGGAVDNKHNSLANHGNSKSIVDKALMLTSRKA